MTTPAALYPTALDHVGLTCADIGASVAFYRDLLGIPVLSRGRDQDEPPESRAPRSRSRRSTSAAGR